MQERARRLWGWIILLVVAPTVLIAVLSQLEWVGRLAGQVLEVTPQGGLRLAMLRVHGSGGPPSLAALLLIWVLSPITGAGGYLFLREMLFDHIDWITPNRGAAILLRILGAVVGLAIVLFSFFLLPGRGSTRCSECEGDLLSLLLLNQLAAYTGGAALGYLACMVTKLRTQILKR